VAGMQGGTESGNLDNPTARAVVLPLPLTRESSFVDAAPLMVIIPDG
jgi:hypothetical protein